MSYQSKQSFDETLTILSLNKRDFIVRKKKSKSEIIVSDKTFSKAKTNYRNDTYISDSDCGRIANLFKIVKACYERYAIQHDFEYPILPKPNMLSKKKNYIVYEELPTGHEMVMYDINHCYWQIAYKNCVIDQKTYDKFKVPLYKLYRNIALASFNNGYTYTYYVNGIRMLRVTEDMRIYKGIYDNIRYTSTYLILWLIKMIPKDKWFMYNTDAVLVDPVYSEVCEDYFRNAGYLYKELHCAKHDDRNIYIKEMDIVKAL